MEVNYYFSYRNLFPRAGGVRESQIIFKGERVEVLSELFGFCFLFADFPVNLFPYVYLMLPRIRVAHPRGGHLGIFWWVCAARDSKLAPRSKKKFP